MGKKVQTIQESFSDEEFFDRMYRKSESENTMLAAKSSLLAFERFCKDQNMSKEDMIKKFKAWMNQDKPDARSICVVLDKFVSFLTQDHKEIKIKETGYYRAKSPKTIKLYFTFIKSYLRICHGIRITTEDVHDFVQFPKPRREPRKPITLKTLKLLFGKCSPERRALYYTLITSGMRLREALSLKKSNFHLNENPVRITILADDTKTREGRETYITSEALEKLKPILDKKSDNDYLFHHYTNLYRAVTTEEKYFNMLRRKLGLEEKYPNSVRYVVNIHAFRAYFITKASQKHGSDYSHALSGHSSYMKQYYRLDEKQRSKMYKELEPELLVESVMIESNKTKDKIIETIQVTMEKDFQKQLDEKIMKVQLQNEAYLKQLVKIMGGKNTGDVERDILETIFKKVSDARLRIDSYSD